MMPSQLQTWKATSLAVSALAAEGEGAAEGEAGGVAEGTVEAGVGVGLGVEAEVGSEGAEGVAGGGASAKVAGVGTGQARLVGRQAGDRAVVLEALLSCVVCHVWLLCVLRPCYVMSVCCKPFSGVLVLSSFAVCSLDCTIQLLLMHLQLVKVASCTHAMSVR